MIEIKKLSELPEGVKWGRGGGNGLVSALMGLTESTYIAVPNRMSVIHGAAKSLGIRVQCKRDQAAGLTYVRLKPEAK